MNKSITQTTEEYIQESSPWTWLKEFTDARIALGRTGCSLPTKECLDFSLAHARAKDAIKTPFDRAAMRLRLKEIGLESLCVDSAAHDRATFLSRPDLGRHLDSQSKSLLAKTKFSASDVMIVIGDGLSSTAVHKQSIPLIKHFLPYLKKLNLTIGPVVLASQCRVALGDAISEQIPCKVVIMMIGERPGLSSPDSLGIYITYQPHSGRLESERNCISNIRPEGLSYANAAFKLAWLIDSALYHQVSGTQLKDLSDDPDQHHRISPIPQLFPSH